MLSKFISIGSKIELQPVERGLEEQTDPASEKYYYSQVYEILSEDTMEILMPMEKGKLVLLPIDGDIDLVVFEGNGMYQCFARIIDRYKSNNVYILVVELTSNLRKYQRREYYRYSCALTMFIRGLLEEEIRAVENDLPYTMTPGLPMEHGTIVDISGGGLRFLADRAYEADCLLYVNYQLINGSSNKMYEMIGKVISVRELENRKGTFEHRMQYYDVDRHTREEIIKYIFEEERKSRRKERLE